MLKSPVVVVTLLLGGVYAAALPDAAPAGMLAIGTQPEGPSWVATWGTGPSGTAGRRGYPNTTFRQVIHTSLGGSRVRVWLSNALGPTPVALRATVALPRTPGSAEAVAGTVKPLTFGGGPVAVIPPRGQLLSDPVEFAVPADADLFVSVYTVRSSGPVTIHRGAQQTSFVAVGGDHTDAVSGFPFTRKVTAWHYVTGVDVDAGEDAKTIVALGDSITDGAGSGPDRNARWPDVLADRLAARESGPPLAVVNAGINGNRLLRDHPQAGVRSLARLDRDVFSRPGVRTVILLQGVNDLKQQPRGDNTAAIVAGLKQVSSQARARGIRVVCGTILPYRGWYAYDALGERIRQRVNAFIRAGGAFDGMVDFDAAVRDPRRPTQLLPAYDSGDHLHPNAAGMRAMADSIDLSLL
jgi:lysophospholipase L1-like esterase